MLTAALEAFDDQSPLGRLLAERRASRYLSVGSDGIVSAPISVVESASELRQLAEKQDTGKRASFWRGTIVNATEAQRQQIMAALCNPSISARFAMRMRGSLGVPLPDEIYGGWDGRCMPRTDLCSSGVETVAEDVVAKGHRRRQLRRRNQ